MATVSFTKADYPGIKGGDKEVALFTWTPITNTNADGAPVSLPWATKATFQVYGTFGGATVAMQGSNDGTNWVGLTIFSTGAALSFAAAGMLSSAEFPLYIRPFLSGGAASSVTVTALLSI